MQPQQRRCRIVNVDRGAIRTCMVSTWWTCVMRDEDNVIGSADVRNNIG
jgi:hypothetical protein